MSASAYAQPEQFGYDLLAAPNHLGAPDPLAVLVAAAQITKQMRLRTYVLNVGFWNGALLARAVATADLLSAGRLELGLGAGHKRGEPFVLLARDGSEAADILAQRHEEFGFDSFTTHEPNLEALAQAIAAIE